MSTVAPNTRHVAEEMAEFGGVPVVAAAVLLQMHADTAIDLLADDDIVHVREFVDSMIEHAGFYGVTVESVSASDRV